MGGRLSLTMHGASVSSWGNPAKAPDQGPQGGKGFSTLGGSEGRHAFCAQIAEIRCRRAPSQGTLAFLEMPPAPQSLAALAVRCGALVPPANAISAGEPPRSAFWAAVQ